MKITLVQCPSWTVDSPPYAAALLSAVLKDKGYQVSCFDLNVTLYRYCSEIKKVDGCLIQEESWSQDFNGYAWYDKESVLNFIHKHEPYIEKLVELVVNSSEKIIGFSVQSTSKFFSLEFARRIKEKDKNKIIVFGGPLCFRNCYGVDILNDFPFLDFVCLGEGEEEFPSLINIIEKNGCDELFPGFGHRLQDGSIKDGGDSPLLENLDELPFAEYSPFNLEKYTKKLLPISTSRGCINRCSFCNESTHWQKYRRRSAENILKEIKYQLEKRPEIEMFWFNDSLINGDIKMLERFCDLLTASDIKIKWGGQGMIRKEMTAGLLQKMKLAGCKVISYGIENGSNRVLKIMRKGYAAELAEEVIRNTAASGIEVVFNIIVGFPSEGEAEFEENKEFVRRCKDYASYVAVNMCLLLKGSYVYSNLGEFNIVPIEYKEPDWQLKWKTNDNQNTYDIRKKRMDELLKITSEKTFYAYR